MLGTLVEIKDVSEGIRSFKIAVAGFSPLPGQYLMLAFPSDQDLKRAFSVIEIQDGAAIIGVKKEGVFTSRLFTAGVGESLLVFGPYGRFVLPKEPCKLVFVAGGIGITPLLSLVLAIHRSNDPWDVDFFYSAKTKGQAAFFDMLQGLKDPRIRVRFFFTEGKDPGWSQERVSADLIERWVRDVRERVVYVCGPKPMMDAVRAGLLSKGVSEDAVKSEGFQ